MDIDPIASNPSFMSEKFRQDIKTIISTEEKVIDAIEEFFSSKKYEDILDEDEWVPVAEKTGKTIEDLVRVFRPIRYICNAAYQSNMPVEKLIDLLVKRGVIDKPEKDKRKTILTLSKSLESGLAQADEKTPPKLPGLRIKSLYSSANVISEFVNEFNTSQDEPDSYEPQIKKLFVFTSLKISFHEDLREPVTIAFSESNLDNFIRWLELARVQHQWLKDAISDDINLEDKHG